MNLLQAKRRSITGKHVKTLRVKGVIPAVVYGGKSGTESIEVDTREFEKVWREAGEAGLVELTVDGSKKTVLIKDVAADPLKGAPVHADFYEVSMDKLIRIKVPLKFIGESPVVKLGASVVKVMHEVDVEALPAKLPSVLVVDLSRLVNVGDRYLVSNLELPEGVSVKADANELIVLTEEMKAEEVAPETAPTLADIEVVGEKGKKEEAAEGEAEPAPAKGKSA